jgi:hypothetical protein
MADVDLVVGVEGGSLYRFGSMEDMDLAEEDEEGSRTLSDNSESLLLLEDIGFGMQFEGGFFGVWDLDC